MARYAGSETSWERQPGESAKAFEAFELYCQMGDARSIRKVAHDLKKSDSLLRRWSSRWNWVDRARDYDNELRRQEIKAEKKAFLEMKKRQIGIAVRMQKIGFEALKNISPGDLSLKDIRDFIRLGVELERASRSNIAEQEEAREANDGLEIEVYLPEKDGNESE